MSNRRCKVTTKPLFDVKAICFGLSEALNHQGAASGIVPFEFVRLDGKHEGRGRRLIGAKSGKHRKKGLILNYCPFCGTRIYKEEANLRAGTGDGR